MKNWILARLAARQVVPVTLPERGRFVGWSCRISEKRLGNGFIVIELLVVVALCAVLAMVALPVSGTAVGGYRLSGAAHAVSYDISLAKMRAAAGFTQARLFVNLADSTYRVESWNKTTSTWAAESDVGWLPQGIGFGFGTITTPPPDTQSTVGFAGACLDAASSAIGSTSCVVFNSRGVPIDATGAPRVPTRST